MCPGPTTTERNLSLGKRAQGKMIVENISGEVNMLSVTQSPQWRSAPHPQRRRLSSGGLVLCPSGTSMSCTQSGHALLLESHSSMQPLWKLWPHGSKRRISPRSKSLRHTAQLAESIDGVRSRCPGRCSETGRDSIAALLAPTRTAGRGRLRSAINASLKARPKVMATENSTAT